MNTVTSTERIDHDSVDARDCFVLKAGGTAFAIPVGSVQTIFRVTAISPVPLGPAIIAGLVNLRGKVVIAISLARRLGTPVRAEDEPKPGMLAVAIEHGGEVYALMVDEVGDVLTCDDDMRVSPPTHVAAERARLTNAYYRTLSGIIPLLDLEAVLDIKADRRSGFDRRVSGQFKGDGL